LLLSTAGTTTAATAAVVPKSLYLADPFIIVLFHLFSPEAAVIRGSGTRTGRQRKSARRRRKVCEAFESVKTAI
jgi:hypothetical protein